MGRKLKKEKDLGKNRILKIEGEKENDEGEEQCPIEKSKPPFNHQIQKRFEPRCRGDWGGHNGLWIVWFGGVLRELASIDFLNFSLLRIPPLMAFVHIEQVKHTPQLMLQNRPCMCNDESWKSDNSTCSFQPTPVPLHHVFSSANFSIKAIGWS